MPDFAVKALEALKLKNFAAARDSIMAFAETNPLELQHFMVKGLAEIGMEDWVSAHDTFAEAIDYFPYQAQLWFSLAQTQEHLGKLDEAVSSLQHSLKLKEGQPDASCALSLLYSKLEKYEEAERLAHIAYEMGASKVMALNALGVALMGQDKIEAAEKVINEALRFEATNSAVIKTYADLVRLKAGLATTPATQQ